MKRRISIIPFDEHDKITFYSFVIDDNKSCEMELFIKGLSSVDRINDLTQIINLLDKISQNGSQERYFRYEGKMSDNVCALPDHYLINSDCRLYCLRYGDAILILGNGGVKSTATYQEDGHLNECVETLQLIDKKINALIKSGGIKIENKTITGQLDFFI